MKNTKILGIGGSPRKDGNTDILLDSFLKGAEASGAETKKVFLRNYSIASCIGCEACRKTGTCTRFNDGMDLLYPEIETSNALIVGSPTYNYNVTADMKAFIDRLYPYYIFTNDRPRQYSSKLAGKNLRSIVFSVCEQAEKKEMGFVLEAMKMPLEALGYEVTEEFPVLNYLKKGAVSKDQKVLDDAFEAGKELALSLQ